MRIAKAKRHFLGWGGVCLCGCGEQTGLCKADKEILAVVGAVPNISLSHPAVPLRLERVQATWTALPPGDQRQRVCEALDRIDGEGPNTRELEQEGKQ